MKYDIVKYKIYIKKLYGQTRGDPVCKYTSIINNEKKKKKTRVCSVTINRLFRRAGRILSRAGAGWLRTTTINEYLSIHTRRHVPFKIN